jgi:hydroxymethylpyrimidine/phosphomethylpyrimidine kinase
LEEKEMRTALTIAGSDSSGGAGIQADIKTMTVHGIFATSVITVLTAQNTTGVYGVMEVAPEFLAKQLDCVFTDIYPDAVKIGILSSVEIMKVVAQKLRQYEAHHVVLDPVMVATSGSRLMQEDAVAIMQEELFPLAEIITPNIPEAEVLTGMTIQDGRDMEEAAIRLAERSGCAVLCKGGHRVNDANDLLCRDGEILWMKGRRIDNPNTHGTGCTLSSAIAANLAYGLSLEEAVRRAKDYMSGALEAQLDLGKGSGPLNHMYALP